MDVSGQAAGSPPILEFDPTREAVIEPSVVVARRDVPSCAVLCFFQDIIERVVREHEGRELMRLRSGMGDTRSTRSGMATIGWPSFIRVSGRL